VDEKGQDRYNWALLSCHRLRAIEIRLPFGSIAYNLGNPLGRLVPPLFIQRWSLTRLQQRLFKTGGRLITHAGYFTLQLAESHLKVSLFQQILGQVVRIARHATRANGRPLSLSTTGRIGVV
jgi:DDE family transposase